AGRLHCGLRGEPGTALSAAPLSAAASLKSEDRAGRNAVVLPEWIEHSTSPLPRGCSTTELRQRIKARAAASERPCAKRGGKCHKPPAHARRTACTAAIPTAKQRHGRTARIVREKRGENRARKAPRRRLAGKLAPAKGAGAQPGRARRGEKAGTGTGARPLGSDFRRISARLCGVFTLTGDWTFRLGRAGS